jgi:hypothetical protein
MHRKFILFTLLIAVCSLAVWAGGAPQKGKGKAKADAGKVKGASDTGNASAECPSPRPKNRGCSIP